MSKFSYQRVLLGLFVAGGFLLAFCYYYASSQNTVTSSVVLPYEITKNIDVYDGLRGKMIEHAHVVSVALHKAYQEDHPSIAYEHLLVSLNKVKAMLELIGDDYKPPPPEAPPAKADPDVCPEKYACDKLNCDYPFFYKGFNIENCTGVPPFHSLLTLTFNFVHYSPEDMARVPKILTDINQIYPQIKIIAAVPQSFDDKSLQLNDTSLVKFDITLSSMNIWNSLFSKVDTKYVYIGRNVAHFMWFERLERLVRQINSLGVYFVGTAYRTLISGQWTNGCEQLTYKNYTLKFSHGYDSSQEECLYCQFTRAPFVTKMEYLKQYPLDSSMPEESAFLVWFSKLRGDNKLGVVCPDSMSFIRDSSQAFPDREEWVAAAGKLQIETMISSHIKTPLTFSCGEASATCEIVRKNGQPLSSCCLMELYLALEKIVQVCDLMEVYCELQGEIVKASATKTYYNSPSPDVQIFTDEAGLKKLTEIKKEFSSFKVSASKDTLKISTENWNIIISVQDNLEGLANSDALTKVFVYRFLATCPSNPGPLIKEVYQALWNDPFRL